MASVHSYFSARAKNSRKLLTICFFFVEIRSFWLLHEYEVRIIVFFVTAMTRITSKTMQIFMDVPNFQTEKARDADWQNLRIISINLSEQSLLPSVCRLLTQNCVHGFNSMKKNWWAEKHVIGKLLSDFHQLKVFLWMRVFRNLQIIEKMKLGRVKNVFSLRSNCRNS